MLFNTLANLRVLIGLDPPRAQAMLDHLIPFLRATLAASRAERTTRWPPSLTACATTWR
jgi:LytS/YehU family sensor histidine kinase